MKGIYISEGSLYIVSLKQRNQLVVCKKCLLPGDQTGRGGGGGCATATENDFCFYPAKADTFCGTDIFISGDTKALS